MKHVYFDTDVMWTRWYQLPLWSVPMSTIYVLRETLYMSLEP